jgi:hypothetical protein
MITEDDVKEGMLSLITRGVIPRDADLSPAFDRGGPILHSQRSTIEYRTTPPK